MWLQIENSAKSAAQSELNTKLLFQPNYDWYGTILTDILSDSKPIYQKRMGSVTFSKISATSWTAIAKIYGYDWIKEGK
ncbi:MAG: hypothetical protein FWB86_04420 [Treponema sp.]|nr:hypothetical protein [Treponema sp.]MCL2250285.1 hypothetical protein [Treponema sp.]